MTLAHSESLVPLSTLDKKIKKKNSDSFQKSWEVYTDTVENAEGALWLACQTPNILSFSPLEDLRPKAL